MRLPAPPLLVCKDQKVRVIRYLVFLDVVDASHMIRLWLGSQRSCEVSHVMKINWRSQVHGGVGAFQVGLCSDGEHACTSWTGDGQMPRWMLGSQGASWGLCQTPLWILHGFPAGYAFSLSEGLLQQSCTHHLSVPLERAIQVGNHGRQNLGPWKGTPDPSLDPRSADFYGTKDLHDQLRILRWVLIIINIPLFLYRFQ